MATRRDPRISNLTALATAVRGYCPNCFLGRLFKGMLRPELGCDVCGLVYERDSSTWLGTAFVLYLLASFGLIAEGVALGLLFGIFPGFVAVMGTSAIVLVAAAYRPARGLWVWCLWRVGFIN